MRGNGSDAEGAHQADKQPMRAIHGAAQVAAFHLQDLACRLKARTSTDAVDR